MALKQEQKLKIERDTREHLKIYFMIARIPNLNISSEYVLPVLAYNLENALITARQDAPTNLNIVFKGQALSVKEFLSKIRYKQAIAIPPKEEPISIQPTKLGKKGLKAGLLYALNEEETCKNLTNQDKGRLKKIIEKI